MTSSTFCVSHIIYARFNFIWCLTSATPTSAAQTAESVGNWVMKSVKRGEYVILTPSRLRPSQPTSDNWPGVEVAGRGGKCQGINE